MTRDRWLGVELRHFAALEAISSERSFRRAATRLGYVQSAISRQIAVLEQISGTQLIERSPGPGPVHLTTAGEKVLTHAQDILASIDAAKADLANLDGQGTGDVTVGVFPGVPTRVLPLALAAFNRRFPGVRVMTSEAATDGPLLEQVRSAAIDCTFAHLPAEPGPFASRGILLVPWALLLPAGSDLAAQPTPPSLEEIQRLPLITMRSPRGEQDLEAGLCPNGERPRFVFQCDMVQTVQGLVASGLGAAIVPRLAVDEHDPRTVLVDLGDRLPPLSLGLVWHRQRRLGPAVVQFQDLVERACRALDRRQQGIGRFDPGQSPAAVPVTD